MLSRKFIKIKRTAIDSSTKTYDLKNDAVFERLYQEHWKLLFAICYKNTNDLQASEEIVQDVFVGLWKRGGILIVRETIKTYLIKCVKTGIIKHYRDKRKKLDTFKTDCDLCEKYRLNEATLQHNEAIEGFLEEDLQLIVNQLPCKCQKVYRMSREEHLSTKEIASILNISPKTVKNHLTKALAIIHTKIGYNTGS